jgi:putative hydrolase of the HAD superfamily
LRIKAMKITFDLGGVLLRWRPHELLRSCLPERTQTPQAVRALEQQIFEGFGGDWAEFDRGKIEPAPLAERIAARTGLRVAEALRIIDAVPAELQPLPDSVALLNRLHGLGRELYFLSNMPEPYAVHLEQTHAFMRLFRKGVFSARVQHVKPEPEIFARAQAAFGIVGEPALFIDDAAHNVRAARAMGWQAMQFRDAAQCETELTALGLI